MIGVGLGLIIVGVTLIVIWWRIAHQTQAARRWPSTPGTIIGGDLRTLISPQAFLLSQGGLHPRAEPRIEYEYQVDGQTYQSDKVRLGTWSLSMRAATQAVKDYAPGTTVRVYFDPQQPSRAILQVPTDNTWGGIGVGVVCVLIGLALLFVR